MKQKSTIIEYSEPIQEIMGSMPSWIVRWGVAILFSRIVLFAFICCFISYPEQITCAIILRVEDNIISGNILVPSDGFGKVTVGQNVIVSLDCYPYLEYGTIKGTVAAISKTPKHGEDGRLSYPILICFPNGMRNNNGIMLEPMNEMSGNAVIIVQEKKMINHFLEPIRKMIKQ